MSDLHQLDRRDALRACAAGLAATALQGCGERPASRTAGKGQLQFEPLDTAALVKGSGPLARALTDLLARGGSNADSRSRMHDVLNQLGLHKYAMYGPLSERLDNFGHTLIFNGGARGYLRADVHNDHRYVEPLIVRRGSAPMSHEVITMGCTMTDVCTSSSDLSGKPPATDITDTAAEDPAPGLIQGYNWDRLAPFDASAVGLFGQIIAKAGALLDGGSRSDQNSLQAWLDGQSRGARGVTAYVGVHPGNAATWYDWLLLFDNGASAMVQTASGSIAPAIYLGGKPVNPRNVTIAYDASAPGGDGTQILFPHVSLSHS